jgi:hypothetical protein
MHAAELFEQGVEQLAEVELALARGAETSGSANDPWTFRRVPR